MTSTIAQPESLYQIGDAEFNALREMLYREAGVSLGDAKRALVCSRLARRLRHLQLGTYNDYLQYLTNSDPRGEELQMLINCLTTNKTDFLREPHHFDFLRNVVIPEAQERANAGGPRRLRIWSAACSQGDEPYSIAMTILDSLPSVESWDVKILASDINTEVLATAEAGKYPVEKIAVLPESWKQKFLQREGGTHSANFIVRPEAKRLITFRQVNLTGTWPHRATFDAIFCRNVIIYFDQATQEKLLSRMSQQLCDRGYLILGHSESSPWLTQMFEPLGQTIFRRRLAPVRNAPTTSPKPQPSVLASSAKPRQQQADLQKMPQTVVRPTTNLPSKNILAGQTYVLNEPGEITTVLGSCVAVCLFDPEQGVGGMNHFMLPAQPVDAGTSARYGIHAMELLITGIMKRNGDRRRLKAKAFGGANLLQLQLNHDLCQIGRQNVEFVREFLATEEIPLVAEKLGGEQPLRIYFHPHTGRVIVKTLRRTEAIVRREDTYKTASVKKAQSTGAITLFN